jgi:mannan endo-1,4-beta-mannosidase
MHGVTRLRSHGRAAAFITAISMVAAACFFAGRALPAHVSSTGAGQGFVTHQGSTLLLRGQSYHFTGLNIYNAASLTSCWYPMGSGPLLDSSLATIDNTSGGDAKVIRIWFFQSMAVRSGHLDWSGFDHTLAAARSRGFLVIPALADQWGDCDQTGRYKTESWYRSGYRNTDPGGLESYRDWVRDVVSRYQSDPTVAIWSLMNEAEDAQSKGGSCSPTAAATLRAFADDVASVSKTFDSNHLVTLGTIGTGQCGASNDDYQNLYSSPNLDVCEYHDYGSDNTALPGDQWNGLQTRIEQCTALGKPIIVGEAGIDPNLVGGSATRASLFAGKLSAQLRAGVAGFLAWDWQAGGQRGGDHYVIGPGDPTLAVLGRYGMAMPRAGARAPGQAAVGQRPPMGFNPYNHFGNDVNETTIKQIADAIVANGMRDAGYVYVNLDDDWQGGRDAARNITVNSNFPSGIAALAAYLHARGLRLGIYTTPAALSCGGHVGSAGHYQQDVSTFASWGVDYIKLDWCGADYSPGGASSIARQWREAIAATSRPMVLSINAGADSSVPLWAKDVATTWRTGDDICASWFNKTRPHNPASRDCFDASSHNGVYDYVSSDTEFDAPYAGPGHWADSDMLEVGNSGLTPEEQRTHFSLWAMWGAPLIAGNDPRTMQSGDVASQVLLNPEVIAIDQDAEGVMARKVRDAGAIRVWTKPLANGDEAVLLVNAGESPADLTVNLTALGLAGTRQLRDAWAHTNLGAFTGTYTASNVVPHASVLLRVVGTVNSGLGTGR